MHSFREPLDDFGANGVSTSGEITERRGHDADFLDVYVSTATQAICQTAIMTLGGILLLVPVAKRLP